MTNYDGVTRTYNAANQMTNDGTNSLTYDNNGNLRTVGSDIYTWDRANRLANFNYSHFNFYDGLGNRVQTLHLGAYREYVNDVAGGLTKVLVTQSVGGGQIFKRYVHAPRGVHSAENGLGDWSYYAQDGLGSVRAIVDDSASVERSMAYDPYGNPTGSSPLDFGFTGEQTDENGSVFLRARYYEPQLGIFSALDPLETPNRYAYVSGNPSNRVDPSGLFDWCTGEVEPHDTLNVIYGATVGLTHPPQSPKLPQREVMRLLSEANVGNSPLYQEGIGEFNITLNAGQNLLANGVTHINISEQLRQAAGISCQTVPAVVEPPPLPPIVGILETFGGFCPQEAFGAFLSGLDEICEIPDVGNTAESVQQIIYDEIEQVYGSIDVGGSINPLPTFASSKRACGGCNDVLQIFASVIGGTQRQIYEAVLDEDVVDIAPNIPLNFTPVSAEFQAAASRLQLDAGVCLTLPTEDHFVMAYTVANVNNLENLVADTNNLTDVPISRLNCGTKLQIQRQVRRGAEIASGIYQILAQNCNRNP
ncbi:MAG: RHS repeat domain-containing protein [Anaerolineae bacterium]